jgi:hypothetical protein
MYLIKSEVYLDKTNNCYKKILVISPSPQNDPYLLSITKLVNREKLSPYKQPEQCCSLPNCFYAFVNPCNKCELLCVDQIAILFSELSKNYSINTNLTEIMQNSDVKINNLICFIEKKT